jgi:hypothetical protein
MALFRIRRPVRLLPGPRLSLNPGGSRAPVGLWATNTTFDRRAHRLAPGTSAINQDPTDENARRMNNPRRQQPSVVSLLVATVVTLWLVLSLLGHH